jgi:RimJ/RimL family protein N-acetyltransferase
MSSADLTGKLVRLARYDLEKDSEAWARWNRDSEYQRLLDSGPAFLHPSASVRSYLEKEIGKEYIIFSIHSLEDDRIVGFIDLGGLDWQAHSAWVAVGIGEAEYRGRGLGTEAMQLLVRFAFEQLNLNRINLSVYEYNPAARRSYEKCGFVLEGCQRQFLNRGGRRWDMIFMGLLKEDWLAKRPG